MTVFDDKGILIIHMNHDEALETIKSLSSQLLSKSPNTGRVETILKDDGRDFSIAVTREPGQGC